MLVRTGGFFGLFGGGDGDECSGGGYGYVLKRDCMDLAMYISKMDMFMWVLVCGRDKLTCCLKARQTMATPQLSESSLCVYVPDLLSFDINCITKLLFRQQYVIFSCIAIVASKMRWVRTWTHFSCLHLPQCIQEMLDQTLYNNKICFCGFDTVIFHLHRLQQSPSSCDPAAK